MQVWGDVPFALVPSHRWKQVIGLERPKKALSFNTARWKIRGKTIRGIIEMKNLHSSMTNLQQWNPDQTCRLTLQSARWPGGPSRRRPSSLHTWESERGDRRQKEGQNRNQHIGFFLNCPLGSKFRIQTETSKRKVGLDSVALINEKLLLLLVLKIKFEHNENHFVSPTKCYKPIFKCLILISDEGDTNLKTLMRHRSSSSKLAGLGGFCLFILVKCSQHTIY